MLFVLDECRCNKHRRSTYAFIPIVELDPFGAKVILKKRRFTSLSPATMSLFIILL